MKILHWTNVFYYIYIRERENTEAFVKFKKKVNNNLNNLDFIIFIFKCYKLIIFIFEILSSKVTEEFYKQNKRNI